MTQGRSSNPGGGVFYIKYILYQSASSIDSLRNSCLGFHYAMHYYLIINMYAGYIYIYGDSGFPQKKYVSMTLRLTSNCRRYENQYPLEASLNKTDIYIYLFVCAYIYIYIYICVYMHTCLCVYTHKYIHAY